MHCVRLLAIETSSHVGSLALFEADRLLTTQTFEHGLQNAARMLPLLDEMLKQQGLTPQQLGAIAVSQGPGSFTGLRLGVTLAKTLCFATGAKLLAVPSLEVIVQNAPAGAPHVMPVLDARRGQVFTALYKGGDGKLAQQWPARLSPLAEALSQAPRPLAVLGEGLTAHAQEIPPDAAVQLLPECLWTPRAEVVGRLALQRLATGQTVDPFTLTPIYLRKPEAQERMEAGLLKHLQ